MQDGSISSGTGAGTAHVVSRDGDDGWSRGDSESMLCVSSLARALGIVNNLVEGVDEQSDHP